jgi:hypothetical protein
MPTRHGVIHTSDAQVFVGHSAGHSSSTATAESVPGIPHAALGINSQNYHRLGASQFNSQRHSRVIPIIFDGTTGHDVK